MSRYRFAVLGDPVEHSRSPQLHSAMLELAGLEGEYLRVTADRSVLAKAVEGLRTGEWSGLNVTMPLKAEAARLAESLSPPAHRSASVNTLALRDSTIFGDSTDSAAFRDLLTSERFEEAGSILVLGAGGSSAAALAVVPDDTSVYLTARRRGQAEDLATLLGGNVISWGAAVAGALVVNTTPIGMGGEELPDGVLDVAAGLIDLPYGGETTPAVGWAREQGIPYCDGHEFLLRQAMASFTLWTGVSIEMEALRSALRKV